MQNTGEDWLVLTQLTQHNASAMGTVMGLQFGPQLLLLPWTGFAADHFNQRQLLLATQASMGLLALVLGALISAAFDASVRQTFVAEMMGDEDLPNAVALNSTLYNGARPVGPGYARADDGAAFGHCFGWSTYCRLGGQPFRPVLGA